MTTKNGKDAVDLDGIRAQLAALATERENILSAPMPLAEATAQLHAHLDGLAGHIGAAGWLTLLAHGDPAEVQARVDPTHAMVLGGLWAVVARETLVRQLEDLYRGWPPTLSDAQRADRLAEVDRRMKGLLVAEERAIVEAELNGRPLARRADVDIGILFDDHVLALEAAA